MYWSVESTVSSPPMYQRQEGWTACGQPGCAQRSVRPRGTRQIEQSMPETLLMVMEEGKGASTRRRGVISME